jgi:hypothetical protein
MWFMRVGVGGKIFGVRAGVSVGRGGVGYGAGAGPVSTTGGCLGNIGAAFTNWFTGLIALTLILFAIVLGLGALVAFVPLVLVAVPLLMPCQKKSSQNVMVLLSLVTFAVLSWLSYTLLESFMQARYRAASDLEDLDSLELVGAILKAGWFVGFLIATVAVINAGARGKRLYDLVYKRL